MDLYFIIYHIQLFQKLFLRKRLSKNKKNFRWELLNNHYKTLKVYEIPFNNSKN